MRPRSMLVSSSLSIVLAMGCAEGLASRNEDDAPAGGAGSAGAATAGAAGDAAGGATAGKAGSAGTSAGSAGAKAGGAGTSAGSAGATAGSAGMTAGSAGAKAGSAGMTAGSAGMTAGSAGTTAGSAGTSAGSAGMTAGSAGTSAGSAGTSAGSAGTSAGSAGTSAGNGGAGAAGAAGATGGSAGASAGAAGVAGTAGSAGAGGVAGAAGSAGSAGAAGSDACGATLPSFDFEAGAQGFTHDPTSGIASDDPWELGLPAGLACHAGTKCWATNLASGGYSNCQMAELVSPTIDLSSCAASPKVVTLTFWHRFTFEPKSAGTWYDGGLVQLSSDDGQTWQDVTPSQPYQGTIDGAYSGCNPTPDVKGHLGWSGATAGMTWTQVNVDVPTPYRVAKFKFRWLFGSDAGTTKRGWAIDDAAVTAQ